MMNNESNVNETGKKLIKEMLENTPTQEEHDQYIRECYYNSPEFLKSYEQFKNLSPAKFDSLLFELNEMTHLTNLETGIDNYITVMKKLLLEKGKLIGDQSNNPIWVYHETFHRSIIGIVIDNNVVAIVSGGKNNDYGKTLFVVGIAYTNPEYRQRGYIKQIYFWIKNNFKVGITNFKQQSPDAVNLYNSLANDNHFKLQWYNTKTKETLPYNTSDIEFRSIDKETDWLAIIEAREDWKFGSGKNPYGHVNHYIYTHFENDALNEIDYLRYINAYDASLYENKKPKIGTYVGARFSKETEDKITKMIKKLKIDNPIDSKEYHTTIIYSNGSVPDGFEPLGTLDPSWVGIPDKFEIFKGRNGKDCLVVKYKCNAQRKRHEFLMKKYKFNYSFPLYEIHQTLTYDLKDSSLKSLNPKDYIDEFIITSEYSEVLDLDKFSKKNEDET